MSKSIVKHFTGYRTGSDRASTTVLATRQQGNANRADYFTKHNSEVHHQTMQLTFLYFLPIILRVCILMMPTLALARVWPFMVAKAMVVLPLPVMPTKPLSTPIELKETQTLAHAKYELKVSVI